MQCYKGYCNNVACYNCSLRYVFFQFHHDKKLMIMNGYPHFFRLDGRAIKRESDTETIEIQVPKPGRHLPNSFTPVTYPTKERLDEAVANMEVVDRGMFRSYLFEYCKVAQITREMASAEVQAEFDASRNQKP